MNWFSDPNAWISLLTLTALEIVLGIDNIIFISILSGRVTKAQQPRARQLGLLGAFVTRIGLLLSITWVMGLQRPLFDVLGHGYSGRDVILLVGGLFLIGKATVEIHHRLEGEDEQSALAGAASSLLAVVAQIMVIDIVFSLDSVITAVGMASEDDGCIRGSTGKRERWRRLQRCRDELEVAWFIDQVSLVRRSNERRAFAG